ncbi:MAG TPA: hypothetical protein VJX67_00965 [Blastocatellia bacterium]|nr:hypothetical protein [Blastocatellia bacterium]
MPLVRFITYRITVRNLGPSPAYYVTLFDDLPAHTTLKSIVVPDGWVIYNRPSQRASFLPQMISLSGALLTNGRTPATITLVAWLNNPGPQTLTNNANVDSSFTTDPNQLNNAVTTQTSVP